MKFIFLSIFFPIFCFSQKCCDTIIWDGHKFPIHYPIKMDLDSSFGEPIKLGGYLPIGIITKINLDTIWCKYPDLKFDTIQFEDLNIHQQGYIDSSQLIMFYSKQKTTKNKNK